MRVPSTHSVAQQSMASSKVCKHVRHAGVVLQLASQPWKVSLCTKQNHPWANTAYVLQGIRALDTRAYTHQKSCLRSSSSGCSQAVTSLLLTCSPCEYCVLQPAATTCGVKHTRQCCNSFTAHHRKVVVKAEIPCQAVPVDAHSNRCHHHHRRQHTVAA